ncbi:hypothetical protein [Streptomyces sp. MST-110588]|uniref:hypothetical protein n=1 Tax=Streptomyces sp. MST-110588 TaxID=2833628 RepID=UPI001F5C779A|nr:hypothetical protein [Streptomyces sp. MST-110588]
MALRGGFEVSFALAPRHATGQYLGVFGPALLTALCVTWGRPGWYVMGALFALTGLAAPLAVRRAQRHRPYVHPVRPEAAAREGKRDAYAGDLAGPRGRRAPG